MVAADLLKHGFMVLFLCLYGFVKPVDCIAYLLVVSVQIKCGIVFSVLVLLLLSLFYQWYQSPVNVRKVG